MADDFYNRSVLIQIARQVLTILVPASALAALIASAAVLVITPENVIRVFPAVVMVVLLGLVLLIVRKGNIHIGAALFVAVLAGGIIVGMIFNGGVYAPLYISALSLCALVAWLYPARVAVVFGAGTMAVGGIFVWLSKSGYIAEVAWANPLQYWILFSVSLGLLLVVTIIPNRMLHKSLLAGEEKTKHLADSEARLKLFQSAVDYSPIAIGMSKPEGEHLYQNKAFTDLFGDVSKDPPAAIYVDKAVGREVFDTIRRGHTWSGDVKMFGRDKAVRDISLLAYAITDAQGTIVALVGIHNDITERLRLEEMMVQSEKMLSVGGLAAGMAHEINNPLAGMMQNAAVVANRLDATLARNKEAAIEAGTDMAAIGRFVELREIRHMLDMITQSGAQAAEIVTNMLSFARKSDSNFVSCDLATLLNQTIDLASSDYDLKKRFDFRAIEIVREFQPDTPPVQCEPGKIQQVILNILRNGAEAMHHAATQPPGEMKPKFVLQLKQEPDSNTVRIDISDNGPGMDSETSRRVFEPFFTTKGLASGTGLGLSVSYFIIHENHNGELLVESSPGQGTTFIIRLPVNQKL